MKSYYFLLALGVCFLTSTQGQAAVLKVKCGKGNQTIQAAVDVARDGDTIEVSGTCTEIVTITTDGITILGDGGTLNGGFIVDGAQRVVIDNLTIDGSTNTGLVDGVRAIKTAHVTVRNSTIVNHTRSAVNIRSTSSGIVEGNTIGNNADYGVLVNTGSFALLRGTAENPVQTITSSSNFSCCANALGVFNFSSARLEGGNEIEATGSSPAISVFSIAYVSLRIGLNTVLGTGGRAISIGRNSVLGLRFFDVTGRIDFSGGSLGEIRRRLNVEPAGFSGVTAVITGDIRVRGDAQVEFGSPFLARNGSVRQGSVTVNGRLDCGGNQGHVSFGTGSGQTIEVVFGAFATNPPSQCKDFNGNELFPPAP